MLAFRDCSKREIEKHPVSRCQYLGSADAGKGFRCNDPNQMQYFMQLEGIGRSFFYNSPALIDRVKILAQRTRLLSLHPIGVLTVTGVSEGGIGAPRKTTSPGENGNT